MVTLLLIHIERRAYRKVAHTRQKFKFVGISIFSRDSLDTMLGGAFRGVKMGRTGRILREAIHPIAGELGCIVMGIGE